MPQHPRRQAPDLGSILAGLKTALTELVEDAVTAGLTKGADGALEVVQQNVAGISDRISRVRGKVRTRSIQAAAPLERRAGVDVVVEGEPRKRKAKAKARSARRS